MSKDFKVKYKDYTPKEKAARVISESIGGILCTTFIICMILSIIQQMFTYIIVYVILMIIIMIPFELIEHKLKKNVRVRKEKYYTSIRESEGKVDLKNILRGMVKTTGEIDLKYLSKQMNKDIEKLRLFVYDLVGSSSLDGKMEGNKFILSDSIDVENAIDTLLDSYADWERQDKGKV